MLKKSESGIGTLIVFIAMILVAAVAAGVLIQTSSGLQSKSLEIGKKTTEEVSKGIDVVQAFGYVESDGSFRNMTFLLRLSAGSSSQRIDDIFVNLNLIDKMISYSNGVGIDCDGSDDSLFSCNFSVTYLTESNSHLEGYITENEVIELSLVAPRNINESEYFNTLFRMSNGISKKVDITSPSAIGGVRVYLYP
ncbi:MAG: hypothetical protein PHT94_03185 [Candidatus Nanoarchaeia archaeon]|nr:hypothetical protein [Candidatus Nanoarchaeia archaeon]